MLEIRREILKGYIFRALENNQDLKIYSLNHSEMGVTDEFTIASYFIAALGNKFYEKNEYKTTYMNDEVIAVNPAVEGQCAIFQPLG